MADPIRFIIVIAALILLVFVLPATLYRYLMRRKVAWRKNINVGWRRHASEAEMRRAACGETRRRR